MDLDSDRRCAFLITSHRATNSGLPVEYTPGGGVEEMLNGASKITQRFIVKRKCYGSI